MRAYWPHLANTLELVHPSAHWSPQPKRQIDRLSRSCTAHSRKSLYFTMGSLIHQNCPIPWGIWTPSNAYDALGPCELTTQTAPWSVQPCLHRWPQSACPYTLQWFARFPFIIVLSHGGSGPHVLHGSFGPPESWTQTATLSFQPFCRAHYCDRLTDWQTDNGQTSLLGR